MVHTLKSVMFDTLTVLTGCAHLVHVWRWLELTKLNCPHEHYYFLYRTLAEGTSLLRVAPPSVAPRELASVAPIMCDARVSTRPGAHQGLTDNSTLDKLDQELHFQGVLQTKELL